MAGKCVYHIIMYLLYYYDKEAYFFPSQVKLRQPYNFNILLLASITELMKSIIGFAGY